MRLYEYARARGLETADVSAAAESLGLNPHPSAGLSDEDERLLDAHFQGSPRDVNDVLFDKLERIVREKADGPEHLEGPTPENATVATAAESGDGNESATAEAEETGTPPSGGAQDAPPASAAKTPPARRPKTARPPADQTRPHPAAMLP